MTTNVIEDEAALNATWTALTERQVETLGRDTLRTYARSAAIMGTARGVSEVFDGLATIAVDVATARQGAAIGIRGLRERPFLKQLWENFTGKTAKRTAATLEDLLAMQDASVRWLRYLTMNQAVTQRCVVNVQVELLRVQAVVPQLQRQLDFVTEALVRLARDVSFELEDLSQRVTALEQQVGSVLILQEWKEGLLQDHAGPLLGGAVFLSLWCGGWRAEGRSQDSQGRRMVAAQLSKPDLARPLVDLLLEAAKAGRAAPIARQRLLDAANGPLSTTLREVISELDCGLEVTSNDVGRHLRQANLGASPVQQLRGVHRLSPLAFIDRLAIELDAQPRQPSRASGGISLFSRNLPAPHSTPIPPAPELAPGARPRLALALEGGGARGAYQAGALVELIRRGWVFDAVVGTSVGAINGAFLAQCQGNLREMEHLPELWRSTARRGLMEFEPDLERGALLDVGPLEELVRDYIEPARVRQSMLPCTVVAVPVDGSVLATLMQTVLGTHPGARYLQLGELAHDEIHEAILASAAIPYLYPARTVAGTQLVDGGVSRPDNMPAQWLHQLGHRSICSIFLADTIQERSSFPGVTLLQVRPRDDIARKLLRSMMDFSESTIERLLRMGARDAAALDDEMSRLYGPIAATERLSRMLEHYDRHIVSSGVSVGASPLEPT